MLPGLTLLEVLDAVHPGLLLAEALTLDVSRHDTLLGTGKKLAGRGAEDKNFCSNLRDKSGASRQGRGSSKKPCVDY